MLETDVPETINEMLVSVRKMGRCGIIAVYAGFANHVNVGALMEKGVRWAGLNIRIVRSLTNFQAHWKWASSRS